MLELEVQPLTPTRTRVSTTAYWHPAGALGLLYWYALAPTHLLIFDGLTRTIIERAARSGAQVGNREAVPDDP